MPSNSRMNQWVRWLTFAGLGAVILLYPAFHTGSILTLDNVTAPGAISTILGLQIPGIIAQRILLVLAVFPGILGSLILTRSASWTKTLPVVLWWVANLFLAERLATGQWQLLASIGALPWLLICVESWWNQPRLLPGIAAPVTSVFAISVYPRAASFIELLVVAALGWPWILAAKDRRKRFKRGFIAVLVLAAASAALHSAAAALLQDRLDGATPLAADLFSINLGHPFVSLLGTVNYIGFWAERVGRLPLVPSSTWLVFIPAFFALPLTVIGWKEAAKERPRLAQAVSALYVLSLLVVASSITMPAASTLQHWLNIAGFVGLRESGKFMGGMLVAQSVGLAYGMHYVLTTKRPVLIALAIGTLFSLLGWLPSTIAITQWALTPVTYPPELLSVTAAANANHQAGIVFPWHRYQSYPFTNGRVVDQLAPSIFTQTVFNELVEYNQLTTTSGDPWQLAMANATSTAMVDQTALSTLLNDRSIRIIVLLKTNDYEKYQSAVETLGYSVIVDTPNLTAYNVR